MRPRCRNVDACVQINAPEALYQPLRLVRQPRKPIDRPLTPLSSWTDEKTARETLRARPRKRVNP